MCGTCGCADGTAATITNLETGKHSHMVSEVHGAAGGEAAHSHAMAHSQAGAHSHDHDHSHDHGHSHDHSHDNEHSHDHGHDHGHSHTAGHSHDHDERSHTHAAMHGTTIALEQAILHKNDELAARNRAWFKGREILALNLVSSPGSGKTSLLERTIKDTDKDAKDKLNICVIEGDQQTLHDAQRIKDAGAAAVQINTGTGCHLEADMVMQGLAELKPAAGSIVMIENVGNLVCPALFDLGEAAKVAILSVTEGEDKPIKYPHMFAASDLMILNKIDLLPHVDFDVKRCLDFARQVNPNIEILQLSVRSGEGLDGWYNWLAKALKKQCELAFV